MIPGSYGLDQIPHRDTFAKHNLLTRGQEIAVEVDQSKAVRLDLEPVEISLHHVRLVHGSPPNNSEDRRIGFAIRYIPTYVRQLFGDDSASLVRGEDGYGYFELEPGPNPDMDPDMLALHRAITERNAKICIEGPASKATTTRARWAYDEGLRRARAASTARSSRSMASQFRHAMTSRSSKAGFAWSVPIAAPNGNHASPTEKIRPAASPGAREVAPSSLSFERRTAAAKGSVL